MSFFYFLNSCSMTGIVECTPALFIALGGQNLRQLKCLFCSFAVPDTPFTVPSNVGSRELNSLINELLKGMYISLLLVKM